MAYIIFENQPGVRTAQQAERLGVPFWPVVQTGLGGLRRLPDLGLGCRSCRGLGEQPAVPLPIKGALAVGSVVQVPAGGVLISREGISLMLSRPARVALVVDAALRTDLSVERNSEIVSQDLIEATTPDGGTFSAAAGFKATLPGGQIVAVVSATPGSTAWTPTGRRIGWIIAGVTALATIGLFAAVLTIRRPNERKS